MTARCFFCGEPAAEGENPRSALCEAHQAIHQHVVSITRGPVPVIAYEASCKCGWSFAGDSYIRREEAIEAHWSGVVSSGRPIPTNRGRRVAEAAR